MRPAVPLGRLRPARAGIGQRRQPGLDLAPPRLELGRQDHDRPQLLERDVDREARAVVGDLEQHAARLAEVDRVEVVAVDDAAVGDAGGLQQRVPLRVLGDGRAPSDVVDSAGALAAAIFPTRMKAWQSRSRRRGPRTGPSPATRRYAPGRARTRARRRTPGARARRGSRGARRTAGRRHPGGPRARARGPRSRRTAACRRHGGRTRPRRTGDRRTDRPG